MKLVPNDTEIAHKHVPASRHKARKIMSRLCGTQTLARFTFSSESWIRPTCIIDGEFCVRLIEKNEGKHVENGLPEPDLSGNSTLEPIRGAENAFRSVFH